MFTSRAKIKGLLSFVTPELLSLPTLHLVHLLHLISPPRILAAKVCGVFVSSCSQLIFPDSLMYAETSCQEVRVPERKHIELV